MQQLDAIDAEPGGTVQSPAPGPVAAKPSPDSRIVTIIQNNRVAEIWQITRTGTTYKEREVDLPKEVLHRAVNGRQLRCDVNRHQIARQEWGSFIIRRYRATRILPWGPAGGLMMLIPGTVLAAGSANRGITQVPLIMLLLAVALITVGGFLTIASGWRILARQAPPTAGVPLESLGVSSRALGLEDPVFASDSIPAGYRLSNCKGLIEIESPIGEWEILKEYSVEAGWYWAQ